MDVICHRCKDEINENIFVGLILPFIADGERKFICNACKENLNDQEITDGIKLKIHR